MSGVRVNLVVEGDTEEAFVRDVLAPALGARGVFLTARAVLTSRHKRRTFRGGMTTFARAERDINHWLAQDREAYVSTMFDLYGLPTDFPGKLEAHCEPCAQGKVELIEARTAERIGSRRFFPYIQLHEFEALLFTDVDVLDDALSAVSPSRLMKLREIRASFETPEEIDEGETTAPSKRLIVLFPGYDKLAYGPLIAGRIGLDTLRACCPHFREWVKRLEGLTGVEEG